MSYCINWYWMCCVAKVVYCTNSASVWCCARSVSVGVTPCVQWPVSVSPMIVSASAAATNNTVLIPTATITITFSLFRHFYEIFWYWLRMQTAGGQTLNDRILAARHSLAGQGLAKAVCKATTEEIIGPKKKHLDCKCWNCSKLCENLSCVTNCQYFRFASMYKWTQCFHSNSCKSSDWENS